VANPVFTNSVFFLKLRNYKLEINQRLFFAAFVVTDRDDKDVNANNPTESKGQARLLGDCFLDLGPMASVLTEISGAGARQTMKFTRKQGDKEVTVGRFIANLKVIGEQDLPNEERLGGAQNAGDAFTQGDITHALPNPTHVSDFTWRIRVDVRCGIDLPLNRNTQSGLPTSFVEVGWTLYDGQPPDDYTLQSTSMVDNNRHPIWNQQIFVLNPQNVLKKEGFLYLCVRDKFNPRPIETVYIPMAPMAPFVPYNLEIVSPKGEFEAKPRLHVSCVLEQLDPESFVDSLVDVVIHNVDFDPLPLQNNRMFLMMSTHSKVHKEVPFITVDLEDAKNLAMIIQQNTRDDERLFISPIMKIPPAQTELNYGACATFTLPKSLLDSRILFFVVGRDERTPTLHTMPNMVAGHTDLADDHLQKVFFAKTQTSAQLPVIWDRDSTLYPAYNTSKCRVHLGCVRVLTKKPGEGGSRPASANIDIVGDMKNLAANGTISDKEKWAILSKELAQKQELIHRMMRETDDKTESLKITGAEIVDLRRQIKMLQSENAILRKRLAHEEQIEIASLVTKEIAKMNMEELRAKIVKVAQAYRDERVRNEEFEKALKGAQKDIVMSRQLQAEYEKLQRTHEEASKKLLAMQQEIQKTQLYRETIKKQEKVIAKLEKLLESLLKDTEKARGSVVELEQLKTENLTLQKQLKQMATGVRCSFTIITQVRKLEMEKSKGINEKSISWRSSLLSLGRS
jgi:hypothetical protein